MSTEQERVVRWKVWGVIAVAGIGASLVVYGYMTGAEWATAIGSVVRGLFGGAP